MVRTHSLSITTEMLSLVAAVDEFKGAWQSLGTLAPERLAQLRHVATIESVGSSTRIEGATLSDADVEALLRRVDARELNTRDEQEVAGYAEVIELVLTGHASIPLNENHIRQLHAMMLKYSARDERHRGQYKSVPVKIEAFDGDGRSLGVILKTSTPFETPLHMEHLLAWHRQAVEAKALHPLLIIGVFLVVFLAIHPFQDGNGRLSRILTTLLLLQAGYTYAPYASLERIIEESRDAYYLALRRTQITLTNDSPDWTPWLTYFLRSLESQTKRLRSRIDRERLMQGAMSELAREILQIARVHGQVSVAAALKVTGSPRATIKKRLKELVESGQLRPIGRGRSSAYVPA